MFTTDTPGAHEFSIPSSAASPPNEAPYPTDVLSELPLATSPSARPFVDAVHDAGWRGVRIKRLRDVEWAAMQHEPWPLGWLEHRPRYALVADA